MTERLRVGAPLEPAAAALAWGLDRPPWSDRIELVRGTPADVADGLAYGDLRLALVPVTAWAEHAARYEVVPGLAVGSAGPSAIARLDHRVPLAEVRRIASAAPGHAAEALVRVLFAESGARPEIVGPGDDAQAVLRVGDEALAPPADGTRSVDLGAAWTALTSLPMIWSVWAAHRGVVGRKLYALLHTARTRGRHELEPVPGVEYRLGRRQVLGLNFFLAAAARHGIAPSAAIRFVPLAGPFACLRP